MEPESLNASSQAKSSHRGARDRDRRLGHVTQGAKRRAEPGHGLVLQWPCLSLGELSITCT